MVIAKEIQILKKIQQETALRVGSDILERWGCSPSQKRVILGLSKVSFDRYQKGEEKVLLSNEQLERLSYIANIHQALRMVFSNPENIYGFMSMKNDNPYFNGASPLQLISTGNFGTLYEVFKRIDAMVIGDTTSKK